MKYDVFDMVDTCGPAFQVISDEEAARLRAIGDTGDTGDTNDTDGDPVGVEIAHGVSAATAAELVGLRPSSVEQLERDVAEHGVFGVGNLLENFEVRRSRDEP